MPNSAGTIRRRPSSALGAREETPITRVPSSPSLASMSNTTLAAVGSQSGALASAPSAAVAKAQPHGLDGGEATADAAAAAASIKPRHTISFAVLQAGVLLASFVVSMSALSTADVGDAGMERAYDAEVPPETYVWPMMGFATAFCLNVVMLAFERESVKFQLALLACLINFMAFTNDYMSWKGMLPIVKDVWGRGEHLGRWVMWLHTTPPMVYLLSIISDFSKDKVYVAMALDAGMLCGAVVAHTTDSKVVNLLAYTCSFTAYSFLMVNIYRMFSAAVKDAINDTSRTTVIMLRLYTMVTWGLFPVIFFSNRLGYLSIAQLEMLWTSCDLLGKVMFSSTLLQGNFLSLEQRRLIAMRVIEEGNRLQVIQELKDLVEQKERFMSGMSHELRTPLNGIIGLSEALIMGSCGIINDAAMKTITTIKTSGSRLLSLINDILDAASMRQHKGQLTIKHEKIQIERIVGDVIDLCQPLAKRGVRLQGDLPPDLPCVLGDTGRLIQIFHNLIGNACKFTHHGTITISAHHKMDEVEISVADTGIGIPDDKFDAIFQAFEQVDMSTTRKYGGTGLGLNLVKQLVEAHGGSITVKSRLNAGTTFFFTLKVWEEGAGGDAAEGRQSLVRKESFGAGLLTAANSASAAATALAGSLSAASPTAGAAAAGAAAAGGGTAGMRPSVSGGLALGAAVVGGPPHTPTGRQRSVVEAGKSVAFRTGSSTTSQQSVFNRKPRLSNDSVSSAGTGSYAATVASAVHGNGLGGLPAPVVPAGGAVGKAASVGGAGGGEGALGMVERVSLGLLGKGRQSTGAGAAAAAAEEEGGKKAAGGGGSMGAPYAVNRRSYDATNVSGPLPLDDAMLLAKAVRRITRARERSQGGARMHVLSVDDDPVNQMVVQNFLGDKFKITQAMDGQEALALLKDMLPDDLPDVILLDVMMPGMSGYEVCREIRESLPLACVPVIMISAKGKEENIVEGLQSGSNDYLIKPFGRQEILARIEAHLRFRDDVYSEGMVAGSEDGLTHASSVPFLPLLAVDAWGTSLPYAVATAYESGQGNNVQVYKQLTMLAVKVTNLPELLDHCMPTEVATALSMLHMQLDESLKAEAGYCIDDPAQSHLTVLTGIKGEADQVARALRIARALLGAVGAHIKLPDGVKLQLAASVHMLPAQGVVVGASHPVMQLTGQLPADSAFLLEAAPPGNVLISARACATLVDDERARLVEVAKCRGGMTFLLDHPELPLQIDYVRQQIARISTLSSLVATTAKRLLPAQRALMELVRVAPASVTHLHQRASSASHSLTGEAALVLDRPSRVLGGTAARPAQPGPEPALTTRTSATAAAIAAAGGSATAALQAQVDKLQRENELLNRQLDEVTAEASRLADEVDSLTAELAQAREELSASAGPASASAPQLQSQLTDVMARCVLLESELVLRREQALAAIRARKDTEKRLVAVQNVMVRMQELGAFTPPRNSSTGIGRGAAPQPAHPPSTTTSLLGGAPVLPVPPTAATLGMLPSSNGRGARPEAEAVATDFGPGGGVVSMMPNGMFESNSDGDHAKSGRQSKSGGGDALLPAAQGNASPGSALIPASRAPGMVLPPEAHSDITVLLEELGLQELIPRFLQEQITPEVLPHVSEETLREMGVVSMGARLKIKMACATLSAALQP